MSEFRDALRYVGGPSAVSWQAFVVSYVISLAAFFAGNSQTTASTSVWVVSVSIAQVAGFIPLVVVRETVLRRSAQPRPWLVLALFVLASVIRGVVLAYLLRWVAGDPQLQLPYRVFGAMPAVVVALALTAVILGAAREHGARLSQLAHLNASLAEAKTRTDIAVATEQAVAVERITQELQGELDDIDADRPAQSAAALHRLATDVVRPLSHQLASEVPTWSPTPQGAASRIRILPMQVILRLPTGKPFMPVMTAVVLAANAFGYGIITWGVPAVFPVLFATFAAGVVGLLLLNALMQAIPQRCPAWVRPAGFVVSILVAGALAASYTMLVNPKYGGLQRTAAGAALNTMGFTVMFAMVKAYWEVQQELVASLEQQSEELRWSVARARQIQWHQQRALSRALHGPVQSALNAAAMRLDGALRGEQSLTPIILSVQSDLRGVLSTALRSNAVSTSLQRAIDEVTGLWSGLCDITVDVSPSAMHALTQDDVCRTAVVDVLIEGASNAIRHGKATRLRMAVTVANSCVRIMVEDDGSAPGERVTQGLGSRLLDECATQWSRESGPGGNTLTADLPVGAT